LLSRQASHAVLLSSDCGLAVRGSCTLSKSACQAIVLAYDARGTHISIRVCAVGNRAAAGCIEIAAAEKSSAHCCWAASVAGTIRIIGSLVQLYRADADDSIVQFSGVPIVRAGAGSTIDSCSILAGDCVLSVSVLDGILVDIFIDQVGLERRWAVDVFRK